MIQFVQMLQTNGEDMCLKLHADLHNFLCEICQKSFNRNYTFLVNSE